MLTKFKKKIQNMIKFEAKIFRNIGLTPNISSAIGLILGILSATLYWQAGIHAQTSLEQYRTMLIFAFILLLFSGFFDALDGALARIYGEESKFGGFLDSLLDRYVDSAIILGFIIGGLCDLFWGITSLIGSILTSYARAKSESTGIKMETVGLVERAERLLLLVLASILGIIWIESINFIFILLALTSNFTVIQRLIFFYRKTK
jgi:archaetidylinositol phosphate synthase